MSFGRIIKHLLTPPWLAWLAQKMSSFNQTIFFLEYLQPNWLPRDQQRQFADGLR